MKHIANIISDEPVRTSGFVSVVPSADMADLSLPTIIVGWDKVRSMFPKQDIMDKKILQNVEWTFSERERRYEYEDDMMKFNDTVKRYLSDRVSYRFFNYIASSKAKVDSFMSYMKHGKKYIYELSGRFLYIYDGLNTIGLSISDIEYMKADTERLIGCIKSLDNVVMVRDTSFLGKEDRFLISGNIKAVPLLKYLKDS